MNIVRKTQLAAAAVAANGIAALALLSPAPALATDCGDGYYMECGYYGVCISEMLLDEICEAHRPDGCYVDIRFCAAGATDCYGAPAVLCFYAPA